MQYGVKVRWGTQAGQLHEQVVNILTEEGVAANQTVVCIQFGISNGYLPVPTCT